MHPILLMLPVTPFSTAAALLPLLRLLHLSCDLMEGVLVSGGTASKQSVATRRLRAQLQRFLGSAFRTLSKLKPRRSSRRSGQAAVPGSSSEGSPLPEGQVDLLLDACRLRQVAGKRSRLSSGGTRPLRRARPSLGDDSEGGDSGEEGDDQAPSRRSCLAALGDSDEEGGEGGRGSSQGRRRRQGRRQQRRLRSRNQFVDEHLEEESGDDCYADLEDFVVMSSEEEEAEEDDHEFDTGEEEEDDEEEVEGSSEGSDTAAT